MRLIMEGFGSKQYQVVYQPGQEQWYVCRLADMAKAPAEAGPEGLEEYKRIKTLWRQKGHTHFNVRCARMRFQT